MHFTDFFSIVEADRDVLNPIGTAKLAQVAGYAGIQDGFRVLDLGCGKGAMLRQWAQAWAMQGTGLEVNPQFVQDARRLTAEAGLADQLKFWEGDARAFQPDPAGYEVVACVGATFALGGFAEALQWMKRALKPGGAVVIGDTYLPDPASLEVMLREGWHADDLRSLTERHTQLQAAGLEVVGFTASSPDDWDHYSSLMWQAVWSWAAEHPLHPDRAEVLGRVQEGRERYFRAERQGVNWGVWVTRVPVI